MLKTLSLAAILSLSLLPGGDAFAHAVLVDSRPAPKAEVAGDAVDVLLHYNSRIDSRRSRLALKGGGTGKVLELRQGPTEADLAATLQGLKPGAYVLHWDVLSVDGHVSRGQIPFTVRER